MKTLFTILTVFMFVSPVQAQYGGGTGEPNDPYLIYTAEQMNAIGTEPNDWDKHFKLMADIDLLGFSYDAALIAPDTNDATWKFDGTPFSGVFDGNGHVISNFTCISTEANYVGLFVFGVGLFGCVEGENAEIKNLGLIDPNVDAGRAIYVGSLVGWLRWGSITNCYVEGGSVSGDYSVGGIAGYNSGTVIDCYANGSVMGSGSVGGMVGYNSRTITNCCASSVVIGNTRVGGMVGYNYEGGIINCCANSVVIGNTNVGGMVGSNGIYVITAFELDFPYLRKPTAKISNCYSTSDVSGGDRVGGLAGEQTVGSTITNCYSTGSVSGNDDVGGLVGALAPGILIDLWGFTPDTISDFYSTANITGNSVVAQILIGGSICEVVNSFWDVETSERATSAGGTGKTTAEMQTASIFLEAGWDFVGETENGVEDIWWISEGQSYPRLWWQCGLAFSPYPLDGAIDVPQPLILRWLPGRAALYHDIYFGEDEDAVRNATIGSPEYKGSRDLGFESYDPGKLALDTTYYWRIDEVNEAEPNSPWKGNVWRFTTADFIVVDDFEDYNDYYNPISDTWDGIIEIHFDPNQGPDPYYTVYGSGWVVGDEGIGPHTEETIVHGGSQSMRFVYDNNRKGFFKYTEVEKILLLSDPRDWTENCIEILSIWFRGNSANAAESLYVVLNGSAVVNHDNPNAALIDEWTEWNIDLQKFADQGVNLTNVNTIALGLGNKKNPLAGGSGTMYFDDIRLYRPRLAASNDLEVNVP
jgi:hypothetical protein